MKILKIAYTDNNISKLSIMEVCLDYPKCQKIKKCYQYELFYFSQIQDLVTKHFDELEKYQMVNQELQPIYLKIDDGLFAKIKCKLSKKTHYEECKLNDNLTLLNAIVDIYRKYAVD